MSGKWGQGTGFCVHGLPALPSRELVEPPLQKTLDCKAAGGMHMAGVC